MEERHLWHIGICGTFDVANYGDLLFPLIVESELKERFGEVLLHRFSYHAKKPPEWPYEVTSVTELPHMIQRLDGLLIGGGFLIRFDKEVAPGYYPPAADIHHPTGYWLTPALLALQHNVPVIWNAPGMHCNEVPSWANPLMRLVLTHSCYVSVRDEPSRSALAPFTTSPIAIVPDTAFRLPRLVNSDQPPSPEFSSLCEASGLAGPYIVLQATLGLQEFVRFLKSHAGRFKGFRFLALPIGPALGENSDIIDAALPGLVRLSQWPSPCLIAELIARSEAVVGHSYHLMITALAAGVPVFTRQKLSQGKYSALRKFDTIFVLPPNGKPDVDWLVSRLGKKAPSLCVRAAADQVGCHWDRIAAALRAEKAPTAPALNRFWQSLPGLLEDATTRERAQAAQRVRETEAANRLAAQTMQHLAAAEQMAATRQDRLDSLAAQLTAARADVAARDARIAAITASLSWRASAPARFVGRHLRNHNRRQLLNLDHIRHHQLQTDPFRWALIHSLFKSEDAESLAKTYPCDHFKRVAAHGGEKDYEYQARALVAMGADVLTYPEQLSPAWQALAGDLLSPKYRAAMSTLTGCDLTEAPMETNVFHYGPGSSLGPHRDLPEKLVTHVLYFNLYWNKADGGCLQILRSANPQDLVAEIPPIAGYSSIIVRSENSWHAVSPVVKHSAVSRRSVTVTFYRPGSASSMWPPGDTAPLHHYSAADLK